LGQIGQTVLKISAVLVKYPTFHQLFHLESGAGPVIQANGRLNFEDDYRFGSLLYSVNKSALSMFTQGKTGFDISVSSKYVPLSISRVIHWLVVRLLNIIAKQTEVICW
jgi:hypothetical protein